MPKLETPLFLMLMLLPTAVAAQDLEAANRAATEANQAFAAKNYTAAAEGYGKAYELAPEPPFLVAQSVALHASGNCSSAVKVAERWFSVEKTPPADQLADMSRIVASCVIEDADKALAASDWAAAEAHADAASKRDASQRTQDDVARIRDAAAKGRAEAVLEKPVVAEKEEASSGGNTQKIIGWTLVGLGGASAVFAVVNELVVVQGKLDAFDELGCSESSCNVSDEVYKRDVVPAHEAMKRARVATVVGWSAAGVLGAAGLGMILFSGNGAEVSWVPPAGASVSVRF